MGRHDDIVWYLNAAEDDLGPVLVLVLEGRLSTATIPPIAGRLAQAAERWRAVVVDLTGVDYINGAAVRAFESAAKALGAAGGELVACGLRPVIRAAFELAGPIPHLTIEASSQAAVDRLLGREPRA